MTDMAPRILLVIDPRADTHPCIEQWVPFLERSGGALELYTCDEQPGIPEEWVASLNSREYRGLLREQRLQLLEELARPLRARGLRVSTCSEWHSPPEERVARHVLETQPDILVYDGALVKALAPGTPPAPGPDAAVAR